MKMLERGVLDNSTINFQSPSRFAQNALYYVPQYGHFFCDNKYHIKRTNLDLYLLFFIKKGFLEVNSQQTSVTASAGSVVLLDCHTPHAYYCRDKVEFYWIHFSGCSSKQYCEYLTEQFGILHSGSQAEGMERLFHSVIYSNLHLAANEHSISSNIHSILANLAVPKRTLFLNELPISPAIEYIHSHFASILTIESLADMCHMSVYHFIRTFKRYLNMTPHEYLLSYRLNQAKQMLWTSSLSIEEIAIECGFNSASHFARAFKANSQTTPGQFRKMRF